MVTRYNADLANNFGNLANRVLNMAMSYCGGVVPDTRDNGALVDAAATAFDGLTEGMEKLDFSNGFGAVWDLIRDTNAYIEDKQPWALNKAGDAAATAAVLGDCLEALRVVALLSSPLIPRASAELWRRLGLPGDPADERLPDAAAWGLLPAGSTLDKGAPLFPAHRDVTWVDSHCHLPSLSGGAEAALDRARAAGVERVVCVGTDLASSQALDRGRRPPRRRGSPPSGCTRTTPRSSPTSGTSSWRWRARPRVVADRGDRLRLLLPALAGRRAGSGVPRADRVLISDGKLRDRESLTRPERELSEDTLRVMAITFSDLDGPETLDALLKQRGSDPVYAHLLYEGLGNLYISKERFQDAALAFEAFAKRRPDDRFAPSLQMRTIEAYQKGGFASLVLEGKQAFVERYAFGSPFWQSRTIADAPEVAAQLKTTQKDLAEYFHAKAQKSKSVEDYTAAARWYRAMLDSFPQDAEAPATRYLLGEVLFESGRYAEAAREYERTAYDYPLHAKSSDAGYAALIAYQKHETSLSGESKSLWHRQYIESSLMFATSFPEHAESARVLTKSDEELFALNEFDRVIEVSKQILERNPPVDRSYQRTAATLMAHSLFDRQHYVEAEAAYLRAKSYLAANDPDRPAIEERIAASIYKQAEAKQSAGDANGAVDDFLRVGMLAPNSKVRAKAEFDAARILVRNKEWDRAAQVLEGFRRNYPNHELMPDVTRNLAVAYLETGRSTQAAGEFERIAARAEETPDVRRDALWQAAELYEKSASPSNAARLYASFVQQYPLPLDPAMDARQKLADMAKAQNDYKARAQWNEDIIRADATAGAGAQRPQQYLAAKATLEGVEPQAAMFMRSSWSRRSTSR